MSKTRTVVKIIPPSGPYFEVEPQSSSTNDVNWSDVDRVIEEKLKWCGRRGWKRQSLWSALNWSSTFTNYVAHFGSERDRNLFDVELRVYVVEQ